MKHKSSQATENTRNTVSTSIRMDASLHRFLKKRVSDIQLEHGSRATSIDAEVQEAIRRYRREVEDTPPQPPPAELPASSNYLSPFLDDEELAILRDLLEKDQGMSIFVKNAIDIHRRNQKKATV